MSSLFLRKKGRKKGGRERGSEGKKVKCLKDKICIRKFKKVDFMVLQGGETLDLIN